MSDAGLSNGYRSVKRVSYTNNRGEWFGPFSEREVQAWYKDGMFHGQTKIRLDDGPVYELAELRARNGIWTPFAHSGGWTKTANDLEEGEARVRKSLGELRASLATARGRLRELETENERMNEELEVYMARVDLDRGSEVSSNVEEEEPRLTEKERALQALYDEMMKVPVVNVKTDLEKRVYDSEFMRARAKQCPSDIPSALERAHRYIPDIRRANSPK